jgi:hypothetical protein
MVQLGGLAFAPDFATRRWRFWFANPAKRAMEKGV